MSAEKDTFLWCDCGFEHLVLPSFWFLGHDFSQVASDPQKVAVKSRQIKWQSCHVGNTGCLYPLVLTLTWMR